MKVCDTPHFHDEWSTLVAESEALFANAAVGVVVVRNGVISRSNARAAQLLASEGGALAGTRLPSFAPVPSPNPGFVGEVQITRPDGRATWLRGTNNDLRTADGQRFSVWVLEEITEREQAREATRRARRRVAVLAVNLKQTAARLQDELTQWRGTIRDFAFEDRLRAAVMNCEMELHYQPVLDLRSGRISSVEALLRWRTADGRWISPSEFVPVAEATGLIHPLGLWTLQEACRQIASWRQQGVAPVPIAVNLSPRQFRHPDLVENILDTLARTGVPPSLIELEITETTLMEEIETTIPRLHRLTAAGIRLAIDDFGVGYSSLSYLRQLPISKLKIDRSFVRELQTDPNDIKIVSAIVGLARNLCLTTVAEGVETAGQLSILQSLSCDYCQGFYFAKPAHPSLVTPLLDKAKLNDAQPEADPLPLGPRSPCAGLTSAQQDLA
jgi:EAL domain-containing protein (putative c-di-GMP-specific phosphodiesterase class I)